MQEGDDQDQKKANREDKDLGGFGADRPPPGVLMDERPPRLCCEDQTYHEQDCASQVEPQESAPEHESGKVVTKTFNNRHDL